MADNGESVQAIIASHEKGFLSTADEVHGTNAMCIGCGHAWPCDVAVVAAYFGRTVTDDAR